MSAARKLAGMLTVDEIAELLALPPDRVMSCAVRHGLPVEIATLRFDRRKVMRWIDERPGWSQPKRASTIGGWNLVPDLTPMEAPTTGGVYAIGAASGHIKIGKSWNIRNRLGDLQHANALPVVLLAVLSTDESDEKEFHAEFAEHRIRSRGEWFAPHPEVIAAIRDARRIW